MKIGEALLGMQEKIILKQVGCECMIFFPFILFLLHYPVTFFGRMPRRQMIKGG